MWNRQQLEKLDADRIVIFAQLSTLNNELKTKKLFHIPSEDRWIDQWPFFWSVFWNINKNLQVKCMAVEGCIVLTKQLKYLRRDHVKNNNSSFFVDRSVEENPETRSVNRKDWKTLWPTLTDIHTRTDTSTVTTHTHTYTWSSTAPGLYLSFEELWRCS